MRVSLVVAAGRNGVIGHRGKIPWRLPDDQKFFKRLTVGHCVVMGRKTFESLPRPLPDRKTFVLSRQPHESGPDFEFADALAVVLGRARKEGFKECFIAGGEAVYLEGMALADRIYLTHVDAKPEGDTFFPKIDERHWSLSARESHPADPRHAHSFDFETWDRIRHDPA
jgi:dihydrofolate reductase